MTLFVRFLFLVFLLNVTQAALADTSNQVTISPIWAHSIGEIDTQKDEIDGVFVDNNGNTVFSGVFRGQVNLDNKTYRSRGKGDIFIASVRKNGSYNWVLHVGGSGDDNTYDISGDAEGNIVLSGWFSESIQFGDIHIQSRGETDMFVAKLSPEDRPISHF